MLDNIKILIEEPQKVRRLLLIILEVVLVLIFATKIYVCFWGSYSLIDFFSIVQWIEFIQSGRILICVFCYLLSYIILFPFLSGVIIGFVILLTNILDLKIHFFSKKDLKKVLFFLSFFELISFKDNVLKKGKHTNEFLTFMMEFQKQETKDEIAILKDSFLSDIIQMYFVSAIVYYSSINIQTISTSVNYIIIGLGVILVVFYIGINLFIEIVFRFTDNIILNLQAVNYIEIAEKTLLNDCGVLALENSDYFSRGYYRSIYFKEEEFIWEIHYEQWEIDSVRVNYYNQLIENTGKKILLVSNKEITETGKKELSTNIILVIFSSEEELKTKLKKYFQEP